MNASANKKKLTVSGKWISQVQLLQMRLAAAEEAWKEAKEQLSQAKRRRKLAKLFAKRAKKHAKAAEAKLELARQTLADAEAQSTTTEWLAAPRKVGKTKSARPRSRKRPTPRRSVQKLPVAATEATQPSPALPATETISEDSNAAVSIPAITNGDGPAMP